MKKLICLIFVLTTISNYASAQQYTWNERRQIAKKIDKLVEDYMEYMSLSKPGTDGFSEEYINNFNDLFADDATLKDDICSERSSDGRFGRTYIEKIPGDYVNDIKVVFPNGLDIVKVTKINVNYNTLQVALAKELKATTPGGTRFVNKADILLDLVFSNDLEQVKIKALSYDNLEVGCMGTECAPEAEPVPSVEEELIITDVEINVRAGEPVTIDMAENNSKGLTYSIVQYPASGNKLSLKKGVYTYTAATSFEGKDKIVYRACNKANDCKKAIVYLTVEAAAIAMNTEKEKPVREKPVKEKPTREKPVREKPNREKPPAFDRPTYNNKVVFSLLADISNSSLNISAPDNLGYTDLKSSELGTFNNSGSMGIGLSAELDYYFAEKIGIGIGLGYRQIKGKVTLDQFDATYKSNYHDANKDVASSQISEYKYYERILRVSDLEENYTLSYLSVPLLLKYRQKISEAIGVYIHAGPNILLPLGAKNTLSGIADYEAIYYDNGNGELSDEEDDSTMSLQLTYSNRFDRAADNEIANNNIDEHFEFGYDIANDYNLSDAETDTKMNLSINILLRAGLQFKLSEKMSLMAGLNGAFGGTSAKDYEATGYKLTDRVGEYNSLLKSQSSLSGRSFGLHFGIAYDLK